MGGMDRVRDWLDRRDGLVEATAQDAQGGPDPALLRKRETLAGDVAELQFDLGGLVYEMAIRDHFRLDVLLQRAARLQEVDAELAETERLLHLADGGASGTCSSCGALHSRGAVFCWQCGGRLLATPAADPGRPPGLGERNGPGGGPGARDGYDVAR